MIDIRGVTKSFGSLTVLRNVSLTVGKGEVVVVIGPSGSGKSTLLRCVNGLEAVDSGEVVVDGRRLQDTKLDLNLLRRNIGVVFQSFNLFPHLSVLRNLTLAPTWVLKLSQEAADERATRLLEKVGIPEKADARPTQLSGGQQQRVAIARALALEPKVLLCDEITSALDPEMVGEVLDVIAELARGGMTMLLVTHEMGFARQAANRLVFMNEGKVCEQGVPASLFDSPRTAALQQFVQSIRSAG